MTYQTNLIEEDVAKLAKNTPKEQDYIDIPVKEIVGGPVDEMSPEDMEAFRQSQPCDDMGADGAEGVEE